MTKNYFTYFRFFC